MPTKIEHIIKNDKELKWCPKCKKYLTLDKFHTTNNRTADGLYYICISCYNMRRNSDSKTNALSAWRALNNRVKTDSRYIKKNIQVIISKKDFVDWYTKNWFPHCVVDRINNAGAYEASNIHLLTPKEHNSKIRIDNLEKLDVIEFGNQRFCYKCKKLKSYSDFYKRKRKISKGNPLGLDEVCSECRKLERKQYYKKTRK